LSEAMERIVSGYVSFGNRAALKDLRAHCRTRIATLSALQSFDASVAKFMGDLSKEA
jgi:hypothetical protein